MQKKKTNDIELLPGRGTPIWKTEGDVFILALGCKLRILISLRTFRVAPIFSTLGVSFRVAHENKTTMRSTKRNISRVSVGFLLRFISNFAAKSPPSTGPFHVRVHQGLLYRMLLSQDTVNKAFTCKTVKLLYNVRNLLIPIVFTLIEFLSTRFLKLNNIGKPSGS